MRGLRRKLNLLEDSDLGIVNKKEIEIMAEKTTKKTNNNGKKNFKKPVKNSIKKKNYGIILPEFCGETIEYKMSKEMAEDIIREDKTKRPNQEILCEHVNSEFGLKGYCVNVHII